MFVHATEAVEVWLEADLPVRMVWRGERWRVTDTPTPLVETAQLTHPLSRRVGWRFQATSASGATRVFDIERRDAWRVVGIYD